MNPTVGHLYHDYSISNTFTYLDAKEQLRTRQINAREMKQLNKYTRVLDRAMSVCKRRHEHEEILMKQQLQAIKSKTPSLDRGLRQETDRLRRYETMTGSCSLPSITQSRATTTTCATGNGFKSSPFRSDMDESRFSHKTSHSQSTKSLHSFPDSFYHGTTTQADYHTANFCKRAEHVTRNLHKLYRRQRERATSQNHLIDILRANNMELLMKAKVFFKDTEAILESILAGNQNKPEAEANNVSFQDGIGIADGNDDLTLPDDYGNTEATSKLANGKKVEMDKIQPVSVISDTESGVVSSTFVNPSIDSYELPKTRAIKWTEIFKTPELWRLHAQRIKDKNLKKEKSSSLVTITAKYRRTMVK